MGGKLRALLDTNIIIHRETMNPSIPEIGTVFYWLDKLDYEKCIHPATATEIHKNKNTQAVASFEIKMNSYPVLRVPSSLHPDVHMVCDPLETDDNDRIDTAILNEIYCDRVNILVTLDKKILTKAEKLGIRDRVYSISEFLDEAVKQYPGLVDYDVLAIRKKHFADINLTDPFFDSLKQDYPEFEGWFNSKFSDDAYVLIDEHDSIKAFLYLKIENDQEPYSDIVPTFSPAKRLKVGTLKVDQEGMRLGERFLKIIFDNAKLNNVDEIYVTIYNKTTGHKKLIEMLEAWGFYHYGKKVNKHGEELVYVRKFNKRQVIPINRDQPKITYPYISQSANFFIIPIMKEFHTDLFPDSILRGENNEYFDGMAPHRNAISKCYVSNSPEKDLKPGDGLIFYRTGESRPGYKHVVTTVGLVENVITGISSEDELVSLTKNKTVFDEVGLRNLYRKSTGWSKAYALFVINFLYVGTLKKRYTLKYLLENHIIDSPPRGVVKIDRDKFAQIIKDNL